MGHHFNVTWLQSIFLEPIKVNKGFSPFTIYDECLVFTNPKHVGCNDTIFRKLCFNLYYIVAIFLLISAPLKSDLKYIHSISNIEKILGGTHSAFPEQKLRKKWHVVEFKLQQNRHKAP